MTDNDKKDFALMMRVTWANYGRNEPDKDTMRYWYSKLDRHDFNVVTKAFDDWIDTSKQLPTIKDIQDACKPKPTIFLPSTSWWSIFTLSRKQSLSPASRWMTPSKISTSADPRCSAALQKTTRTSPSSLIPPTTHASSRK